MQGTAWKLSKYGAFSGPYFPLFGMNTKTTNTLFTQWEKTCDVQHITAYQNGRYDVVYSNENLSWNKSQLVLVFQIISSINWKLSAFSFIRKAQWGKLAFFLCKGAIKGLYTTLLSFTGKKKKKYTFDFSIILKAISKCLNHQFKPFS